MTVIYKGNEIICDHLMTLKDRLDIIQKNQFPFCSKCEVQYDEIAEIRDIAGNVDIQYHFFSEPDKKISEYYLDIFRNSEIFPAFSTQKLHEKNLWLSVMIDHKKKELMSYYYGHYEYQTIERKRFYTSFGSYIQTKYIGKGYCTNFATFTYESLKKVGVKIIILYNVREEAGLYCYFKAANVNLKYTFWIQLIYKNWQKIHKLSEIEELLKKKKVTPCILIYTDPSLEISPDKIKLEHQCGGNDII